MYASEHFYVAQFDQGPVYVGKSFIRSCLWRFGVKRRQSSLIRAVSGAPLSIVKLKRRYINSLNE